MNVLSIEHLSKKFGDKLVINDLSLSVGENSIFGFIGQNGAGKTTTMKMVLGLLKPTGGTISVCGEKVKFGQTKTNRYIGYLPDVPEFYNYMNAYEYLMLCGEITGMTGTLIKEKSGELLELVGLSDVKKKIGGYSRGMKQRLGFAQALLNEPKLLICDEPTSALDPKGRKEILELLSKVKGRTTVIFSTHILSDVERICDHAALLHNGKIALSGTLNELKSVDREDSLLIEFETHEELLKFTSYALVKEKLSEENVSGNAVTLKSNNIHETEEEVFKAVSENGIHPLKIEVLEPTLENVFLRVVS